VTLSPQDIAVYYFHCQLNSWQSRFTSRRPVALCKRTLAAVIVFDIMRRRDPIELEIFKNIFHSIAE